MTLIELIVCISLLAVLVGQAAPSFSSALSSWRRDSAIRDFMGDLQLARSTAIRTSRAVVMCVSTDGSTCATGQDSDDWRQSRLVFSDLDGNDARNNDEPVIVQRGPIVGLQRMSSNVTPGRIAFRSNGLLNNGRTTVDVLANGTTEHMRIRSSRRADVQRALVEAAQFMRRFHSSRDTYTGATLPAHLQRAPSEGAAAYDIRLVEGNKTLITAVAAQSFTLQATRTGMMANDRCGDLVIADTGLRQMVNAQADQTLQACFKGS